MSSTLSENDRRAYEQYLMATSDDERQTAIKRLIPGSHLFYHLYFLERFKQVGSKLDETDKKHLNMFQSKY